MELVVGSLGHGSEDGYQVMVKLDDVYMLPADAIIDEALAHEVN